MSPSLQDHITVEVLQALGAGVDQEVAGPGRPLIGDEGERQMAASVRPDSRVQSHRSEGQYNALVSDVCVCVCAILDQRLLSADPCGNLGRRSVLPGCR